MRFKINIKEDGPFLEGMSGVHDVCVRSFEFEKKGIYSSSWFLHKKDYKYIEILGINGVRQKDVLSKDTINKETLEQFFGRKIKNISIEFGD